MTLPASGQISLQDIVNEFGGTAPHSINEYYRGGSRVVNIAANASIPTSGQISLSNFYGAKGGVTLQNASIIDNPAGGYTTTGIKFLNTGQVQEQEDGLAYTTVYNWLVGSNATSSYEIFFGTPTGDSRISATGTFDTWLNLGTTREVTFTFSNSPPLAPFDQADKTMTISIRDAVSGTVLVIAAASAQVTYFA